MLPIYTTDTKTTTTSTNTSSSSTPPTHHSPASANPTRHARKLSHIQFNKRTYTQHQDDYASSTFMIPFDESLIKANMKSLETTESFFSDTSSSSKQLESPSKSKQRQQRYCRHWLFSSDYWGPFSKGEHWPLFTYIMMAFAIIVFSAELLMSKQSSGEFFELEPFNYMLGPSIEIMVQVGARFPPCMRRIESMPPDEHYVCLNTIAEKSKTPIMSNQTRCLGGGQSLLLLDPVADLADPRLMNSSCSLSSICGIVEFHESHVPDQTFRFLTPLFIHTGLIHLGINLSVLILLGAKVERIMNPLRFSILYIGSGIFGHALGANFAPATTPFLGCSGSLFGAIGYLYIDLISNWKQLQQPMRHFIKLLLGTAFSFILGLLPGVDNFSHMGGLVAGVLLSLFLLPPLDVDPMTSSRIKQVSVYVLRITSLCLYAVLLGVLIHHFATGDIDQECPYCRYISCLPINGFCD